jgi:uncharacterized protein (TIGR03437 family)
MDLAAWLYDEGSGNAIQLFRGRGDGTLHLPIDYFGGFHAAGQGAADLDGDGRPDLIAGNPRLNTVTLLMGRAQGGFSFNRAISAASGRAIVAANSLATLYVGTVVTAAEVAQVPYPTRLGGIGLDVRDSAGTTRAAPLVYVSPNQVNFLVPDGTASGEATLIIASDRGPMTAGGMQVDDVAPGLFLVSDANSTPAATGLRVMPDGRQTPMPVFNCSPPSGAPFSCGPATIRLANDSVYLSFYATGFRGATAANVVATMNGVRLPVEYAGPQGAPGIDQINVHLLPEAVFSGPVFLMLAIDGVASNPALLQVLR